MNVRHYPPISLGAFQDMIDELRGANWNVENVGTRSARVTSTSGATKFKIVTDEDGLRAQLLAGDDTPGTWKPLEETIAHHTSVSGDGVSMTYEKAKQLLDRWNSGDKSLVREIQNALHDAVKYGTGKGPDESGVPNDADTRATIRAFQKQSNIDPTGKLDIVTLQALNVVVSGVETTRWDTLASELAALDSASVVGSYVDTSNGDGGPMVAGEPKTKTFSLTPDEVQKLLDGARGKGFDVTKTGDNSYAIDTHTAGVKLSASYDASSQTATITITNADFYVPNSKVWEKIQPLMPQHVQGAADGAAAAATPATTDAEGHVSYLEMGEQKIRNAWDKAQELDDAAKKRVREKAAAALDTAKDLAKDVEQGLRAGGGALHDRAVAIKEKLKNTAAEVVPWYLAIGVGTWLLVGGVLWFVYEEQKKSGRAAGKELAAAL